jgi:hypothetical protein
MAKKVIDNMYTFDPATRTVTIIGRYCRQESILLITNLTAGTVIFNFSDPDLKATSYSADTANYPMSSVSDGTVIQSSQSTTIILNYDTSGMSSTDKLMITIDEPHESFVPSDIMTDPVQKLRVSTPQSMMDTDFEYSVQPSKWESLTLVQNYPSFYARGSGGNTIALTGISGGGEANRSLITVDTSPAHGLQTGDIVSVQETTNQLAEGTFTITRITDNQFTYRAKGVVSSSIYDPNATAIYGGGIYSAAAIPISSAVGDNAANSVVTVTTTNRHGLFPGAPIIINGAGNTLLNGNWTITAVESDTTFKITVIGQINGSATLSSARLTVSPEGYAIHRALDGGVSVTAGGNSVGVQQIRQTRRYFRYQSGKGMQFSTGLKMTPTHDIQNIEATGNIVTVTTLQDHNLQIGAVLLVENVEISTGADNFYNGRGVRDGSTYVVTSVLGTKQFTYLASGVSSDLTPGGDSAQVTCVQWDAAKVRAGLFDNQNGFFFEYDGKQLFACRRQGIREQFGSIAVVNGSGTIAGTGTRFREQLIVGEQIIIKGQTYEIQSIASDTSLVVNPVYQGASITGNVKYLKIQTYKVPQNQWNLDRCDGTGPSGYNIDIAKMQMAYIDYTWYGAGHIRFGFRGVNGDIVNCHRMPNNNVNTSAYMRSGNLPARFEVSTIGYFSKLVAGVSGIAGEAFNAGDAEMYVKDAQYWPNSGYVLVSDGTKTEMIRYTSKGTYSATAKGWRLAGLSRRATFNIAGIGVTGGWSQTAYALTGGNTVSPAAFTPDGGSGGAGTAQVSVTYVSNTCAPIVSHWGVSVIMDGRYDDDKSYIFTAGMNRYLAVTAGTQSRPLIAIRIAPSVDSGNGRNFGIREVVNRMQLTLAQLGVFCQGQFLIEGILNPTSMTGTGITIPTSWQTVSVGSGSLAQAIYFDGTNDYNTTAATASGIVTGGDRVFGFYTENAGGTNFSATSYDLSRVRELGTSILSGNGDSTNPGFPTGPDLLIITARNIATSGTSNIACRISWTEAQA